MAQPKPSLTRAAETASLCGKPPVCSAAMRRGSSRLWFGPVSPKSCSIRPRAVRNGPKTRTSRCLTPRNSFAGAGRRAASSSRPTGLPATLWGSGFEHALAQAALPPNLEEWHRLKRRVVGHAEAIVLEGVLSPDQARRWRHLTRPLNALRSGAGTPPLQSTTRTGTCWRPTREESTTVSLTRSSSRGGPPTSFVSCSGPVAREWECSHRCESEACGALRRACAWGSLCLSGDSTPKQAAGTAGAGPAREEW